MLQSIKKLIPKPVRSILKRAIRGTAAPSLQEEVRPGIFFVTLPKSGTIFTWNNLVQLTGTKFPSYMTNQQMMSKYCSGRDDQVPGSWAVGDFTTQKITDAALVRKYIDEGNTFGAHMPASFHNIEKLTQSGIGKVTVLLRDPRDTTVSWTHHIAGNMKLYMAMTERYYHIPPYYAEWNHAEQLAFQVRTFLPMCMNWIESWLSYYATQDKQLAIQLVYFDELQSSPKTYFRKILAFHGFDPTLADSFAAPTEGKWHFRKGKRGEWENEFSERDKQLSELLIADRIQAAVDAAVNRHPMSLAADAAEQQGESLRALQCRVKVANDLPLTQSLENRLLAAATQVGKPLHAAMSECLAPAVKDAICFDPALGPALDSIALNARHRQAA